MGSGFIMRPGLGSEVRTVGEEEDVAETNVVGVVVAKELEEENMATSGLLAGGSGFSNEGRTVGGADKDVVGEEEGGEGS